MQKEKFSRDTDTRTGDNSSQTGGDDCNKHMTFTHRGDVDSTKIPKVLSDGILAATEISLTLNPLPIGSYKMQMYFHDAALTKPAKFEVLVEDSSGKKSSLGTFSTSVGSDASKPSIVTFEFDAPKSRSLEIYIRNLEGEYVFNGFELAKFALDVDN